jgi:hypothetical protein
LRQRIGDMAGGHQPSAWRLLKPASATMYAAEPCLLMGWHDASVPSPRCSHWQLRQHVSQLCYIVSLTMINCTQVF